MGHPYFEHSSQLLARATRQKMCGMTSSLPGAPLKRPLLEWVF